MELAASGIAVSLVIPGNIVTPIWQKSADKQKGVSADTPLMAQKYYGSMLNSFSRAIGNMSDKGLPPDAVASLIFEILTVKRPKARYVVGKDAKMQSIMAKLFSPETRDRLVRKALGLGK